MNNLDHETASHILCILRKMGGIDDERISGMVLRWTEPDGVEFIFYGSAILHWEKQIVEGVIPSNNPFWFDPITGATPHDPTTIPPIEPPQHFNCGCVKPNTVVGRAKDNIRKGDTGESITDEYNDESYGFNAFNHNNDFRKKAKRIIKQKHKGARLQKFSGGLLYYEKN